MLQYVIKEERSCLGHISEGQRQPKKRLKYTLLTYRESDHFPEMKY